MQPKQLTFLRLLPVLVALMWPASAAWSADADYKESETYQTLRDSLHHAFNDDDSARFFVAVRNLENYLLQQDDLHAYYTQRCNEIVFLMNRQRIFEAYKLATQLSKELTERKLDKEMYMAINMMGHIYRYCGNRESAKQCFEDVIRRMEREGYAESQPAIYMNLVNIAMDDDPQEALRLIDKAADIARKYAPERVFDIEARRTLVYYHTGDKQRFMEGYQAYRDGLAKGLSTVHGHSLEVYYLAMQGRVDEAAALAKEELSDWYGTVAEIYADAGRWHEAYDAQHQSIAASDSLNSLILSSSMQGIQDELRLYEARSQSARIRIYALTAITGLLLLLVVALVYIVQSRRRHLREMQEAYRRVVESDKMKTDFIQNVSHEVRTPLNIISGFAQVIAAPDYDISSEERQHIADTMMHHTRRITTMIDEILEMSVQTDAPLDTGDFRPLPCNEALRQTLRSFLKNKSLKDTEVRLETTLPDEFSILTRDGIMQRILTPLLDNAVKNTPGGLVVLSASAADGVLTLAVEDNGCGVPAAEAEHIFERFVKLDSFKEGLGLGLTFSRTMARRIGGDVALDTAYAGPGARFVVTIPVQS